MKVVVWDKISPINGVPAEVYLANNNAIRNDDLILVMSGDIVTRVESTRILADSNSIDITNKTPIEIFEEFNRIEFEKQNEELTKQELLEEQIAQLKADNEKLRVEMAQSNTELFEMMLAMSGGLS